MPALNVGINSTFEQQRVVINTLAVDVNSILTGNAGLSTYSPISGVSSNTVRFDGQLPSYYLNYANLTGKPTAVSDFTNDLGFVTSGYFANLSVLSIGGTITAQNVVSSLTGTASTALKIPIAESGDNDANYDIPFINGTYTSNGDHDLQVDSGALRFNPGTNTLSANSVAANLLSGELTGNATGLSGNPSISVQNVTAAGNVNGTFIGDLTGNVTGNLTGNVTGSLTGTASSATVSQSIYEHSNVITSGIVSATSYFGDGSNLTGIVASGTGLRVEEEGAYIGAATTVNFVGSAVTASLVGSIIEVAITDTDTVHWTESTGNQLYRLSEVAIGTTENLNGSEVTIGNVGASGTSLFVQGNTQTTEKFIGRDIELGPYGVSPNISLGGNAGNATFSGDVSGRDFTASRNLVSTSGLRVGVSGTSIYSIGGQTGFNLISPLYLVDINGDLGVRGPSYFTDHIHLSDNKQFKIGDNTDLRIYHDTINTHIAEQGQGSLIVRGSTIDIKNDADTQNIAKFSSGAGVKLYYSNSEKFETLGTGSTTYGDHFATKFIGDGSGLTNITASATGGVTIQNSGSNVGTAVTLNFTGSSVSSSVSNGIANITVSGGGGSGVGYFDNNQTLPGIHTTAANVGLGTTNPRTPLQVGKSYGVWSECGSFASSAGVAKTTIGGWSLSDTDFKTAEFTLYFNFEDGRIQSQKALAMNDGTNAYLSQYAIMNTGTNLMAIDASISNNEFILSLTPEAGVTGLMTYIVTRETTKL